ncbi:MAG: hypothetical protein HYZ39_04925 [Mycolicibacterium cosmeticum]|nr:hypothetical protein [Mycolicibacterium cosmeticum]
MNRALAWAAPTGSTVPVESVLSCVVYSAATGEIQHTHIVVTLEGGRTPNEDAMAREAVQSYIRSVAGADPDLHVLHVTPDALDPSVGYRVDHASGKLVPKFGA